MLRLNIVSLAKDMYIEIFKCFVEAVLYHDRDIIS